MASIHTHPRSPFWMAHYFHDGKRTTKSTRVPAEEEGRERAQQIADAWERAASMAGEGRDGREWMAATLNEIFGAVGLPVLKKEAETWESASARWLEVCRGRRANAPSTLNQYERAVAFFGEFLGAKRRQDIGTITTRDIDRWVTYMQDHYAPGTVGLRLQQLSSVFNWAVRQDILVKSPMMAVERPSKRGLSRLPFTPEDLEKILSQARFEIAAGRDGSRDRLTLILLGLCTGARLMDCARMKWSAINLDEALLTYLPQKKARGQQTLSIALAEPLLGHLRSLRRDGPSVCPFFAGMKTSASPSYDFVKFLERTGIDCSPTRADRIKTFRLKSFHSLRHTLATLLHAAGVDDLISRRITGHESAKVAEIYRHVSVEATGRALNQVLAPYQGV